MAAKARVKKPAQVGVRGKGRPTTVGKGKPSRTTKLTVPLTPMQQRFVELWMVWRNASKAYRESHPEAGQVTADSEGSKLFRDPRISTIIKRLLDEERARVRSSSERVTDTLAAMAFTSPADVCNADGNIVPLVEMTRDVAMAVKRMKRKELLTKDADGAERVIGHFIEVEMHDKVHPLRLLGLEQGMFKEKVELGAGDALLEALRRARERSLVE